MSVSKQETIEPETGPLSSSLEPGPSFGPAFARALKVEDVSFVFLNFS